jgi:hypothetical protein
MFKSQFNQAKSSLLHDLGPATKISIALDGWSAANHLSFLAVKAYYINSEWHLQERLLDFIPLRGSHTGRAMAADVIHILSETGMKRRLLAITCDNAGNNRTLGHILEEELEKEDIHWSAKENMVPCLAHIINLVVQEIIRHLKLTASTEVGAREPLQRRHLQDIGGGISVPNSLRKVC